MRSSCYVKLEFEKKVDERTGRGKKLTNLSSIRNGAFKRMKGELGARVS